MNSKCNKYILPHTKMETERTIQVTCCSNIFQENYNLANIYRKYRSQMLHQIHTVTVGIPLFSLGLVHNALTLQC